MIFAKPPGGFKWVESEHVKQQLEDIFKDFGELKAVWASIRARLIHTGHREGTRVHQTEESNVYLFAAVDGYVHLQLIYTLLGDTLTVQSVRTEVPF